MAKRYVTEWSILLPLYCGLLFLISCTSSRFTSYQLAQTPATCVGAGEQNLDFAATGGAAPYSYTLSDDSGLGSFTENGAYTPPSTLSGTPIDETLTITDFAGQILTWSFRLFAKGGGDPSFGTNGRKILHISDRDENIYAAVVDSQGRILLAGSTKNTADNNEFLLVRLLADGSLDPSFGTGGVVTVGFTAGSSATARAIALHPSNGKIAIAGSMDFSGQTSFAIAVVTDTGALDTGFSTDGKTTTTVLGVESAFGVAYQNDGKLLVAGDSSNTSGNLFAWTIVRFLANGAQDTTYYPGGVAYTSFQVSPGSSLRSMLIQPSDGKVLLGGSLLNGTNYGYAVKRVNTDGTADNTYGTSSMAYAFVDAGGFNNPGRSITLQSDEKVVIVGTLNFGATSRFGVARFTTAGVLDSTFGTGGEVDTNPHTSQAWRGAAMADDGRIILSGWSTNATDAVASRFTTGAVSSTGVLETEFGCSAGYMRDVFDASTEGFSWGIVPQGNGMMVAFGYVLVNGQQDAAIFRFKP